MFMKFFLMKQLLESGDLLMESGIVVVTSAVFGSVCSL